MPAPTEGYGLGVNLGVGLGVASAASFGVCDFVAGLGARRSSFWWVTLLSLVISSAGAWCVVGAQAVGRTSSGGAAWGIDG